MDKQLTAIIEREAQGYVSLCPELDIASQGDTYVPWCRSLARSHAGGGRSCDGPSTGNMGCGHLVSRVRKRVVALGVFAKLLVSSRGGERPWWGGAPLRWACRAITTA